MKLILILSLFAFRTMAQETGWSEFKPSVDSRVIYVSSSGSDTNKGTITAPVKTAAKALALTRAGFPDQILFKRGDTFPGYPKGYSGRSVTEPFVMGAYGTGERPIFKIEPDTRMDGCGKYRVFSSMHFINYKRDPQLPSPAAEPNDNDGIVCIWREAHDIRFEDMKWEYFRLAVYYNGGKGPGIRDLTFYRNVYKDAWAQGKGVRDRKAQGTYMSVVTNAKWIENIFYRNGWSPYRIEPRSYLNHSLYIYNMKSPVVRGNISALSSGLGLKFNADAGHATNVVCEDNFIIGASNGISVTSNDKVPDSYQGVHVNNNVHTHIGAKVQDDSGALVDQGLGMYLRQIHDMQADGNVFVDKNYKLNNSAISYNTVSGIKEIKSNVVYKYSNETSLSDPTNLVEPTADKLVDATRNINTYFGVPDGEKALYARLPSMRKGNWDSKYTAPAINAWIRAGIKKK